MSVEFPPGSEGLKRVVLTGSTEQRWEIFVPANIESVPLADLGPAVEPVDFAEHVDAGGRLELLDLQGGDVLDDTNFARRVRRSTSSPLFVVDP